MKKILLYSPIYDFTASAFVEKMLEVDESEDLEIWMNSPGGSVFAGWGIIGALNDRKGKNNAKVFGDASSMALYSLIFMDYVESIDVSKFILHRADGYVENEDDQKFLDQVNSDLRTKLEAKIDIEQFEKISKVTMDDVFDPEKRIDVVLTAKQAEKIGLINKVVRLQPKQIAAMSNKFVAFAEFDEDSQGSENQTKQPQGSGEKQTDINIKQKTKNMTRQELQTQHPELYAEVVNEGVLAERDRCEAFLEFVEVDAESVKKQITDGSQITHKFMAEMTKKMMASSAKDEIKADTKETEIEKNLPEEEKSEKEVEAQKFEKEVYESMNLKKEEIK